MRGSKRLFSIPPCRKTKSLETWFSNPSKSISKLRLCCEKWIAFRRIVRSSSRSSRCSKKISSIMLRKRKKERCFRKCASCSAQESCRNSERNSKRRKAIQNARQARYSERPCVISEGELHNGNL